MWKDKMSSRYDLSHAVPIGFSTPAMNREYMEGAVAKPKGMHLHWYRPLGEVKAVQGQLSSSIFIV